MQILSGKNTEDVFNLLLVLPAPHSKHIQCDFRVLQGEIKPDRSQYAELSFVDRQCFAFVPVYRTEMTLSPISFSSLAEYFRV